MEWLKFDFSFLELRGNAFYGTLVSVGVNRLARVRRL